MIKIHIAPIVMALAAITALSPFASAGPSCSKAPTGKPAASRKIHVTKKVVSAVCPVMGNKIADVSKAAGKSVYKGKTYYFCCPDCKPIFDKNPAKYAK